MTPVTSIARHFDTRAARYDNPVTTYIGERELSVIRTLVPLTARVLDYGCGTGRVTLDHLKRGCEVTAYDLSPQMISVAEAKARRSGFSAEFTSDAMRLAGRRWPIVTCIGVLDYYPDPVPLLKTLRTYLTQEGDLIVTFPNALSPLGWAYALGSRLTFPAIPRTPQFARRAAARAGLHVFHLGFAFPAAPPLGLTLVMGLTPLNTQQASYG